MMFDYGGTENSIMDNGGGLRGSSWVAVGGGYYWLLVEGISSWVLVHSRVNIADYKNLCVAKYQKKIQYLYQTG